MIRGLIETSMVDWDGKLSMVLFFDRCNFACPFCQNWDLLTRPEVYPPISLEQVIQKLLARREWIDGVVLSGGEPLVDEAELGSVIDRLRSLGVKIKLDTNGSMPQRLQRLITERRVDYVAMDIKAPLDKRYHTAAGVQLEPAVIRESIRIIRSAGIEYEFRTTLVPGLVDEPEIQAIGEEIKGALLWYLQIFISEHAPRADLHNRKYSREKIDRLLTVSRRYVPSVKLRGNY